MANKVLLTAVLLISVLFAAGTQAQTQNTHMKFMGISMGDSPKTFIQKAGQKGLKRINRPGGITLSGKLFYSDVLIDVVLSPKSNVISYVLAVIDAERNFEAANWEYQSFLNALTEKYGNPDNPSKKSIHKALYKRHNDEDGMLQKDGKKYIRSWLLAEGEIVLKMSNKFIVSLIYYDRVNLDKSTKELKKIINDQL